MIPVARSPPCTGVCASLISLRARGVAKRSVPVGGGFLARQGAWFLPPRSAALHRPISRQEDLIYSPFSDCSSARRRPIFGLWLTWHHPAVRAMPCRAFRRLPHSAETQAAEMWPLFSPISVVSVFWLLDLTVVVLLPLSDPFTRYRFKIPAACRENLQQSQPAAHSYLVTFPPRSRSVTRSLTAAVNNCCLLELLFAGASTRVLPRGSFLRILTQADSRERLRQSPLPNRLSR